MKFKTFEITKREFLVSIIIVCAMICLGFFIDDKVQSKFLEDNERYYKATKINNDKDLFDYAMKTSVGDSLISGEFKSVDSVSIEELKGDYWFIERTEEKYTMHTRVVTTKDSKGHSHKHTETYWTWDYYNSIEKKCSKFNFLDKEFDTKIITNLYKDRLSLSKNILKNKRLKIKGNYAYINNKRRYYYEVIPKEFNGTMYANLKNNTIVNPGNKNIEVFKNESIQNILENNNFNIGFFKVVFWIIWILVTTIIIYVFYYLKNDWLEDK
ncbi:hypothetical protein IC218_21100 [Clostridioides sp. ES-S-0005-03]|uniref:hypothetical protein n=1 Tax=unclassified Clostridioides TaxID=2635829 RepID=UPI001D11DFDD|nr:hypothetical protein [Clostridioides sp. ES-S-0173-01]MCC0682726.1 hypothetical protein [Clostridioides sp. ES-S-0005-03]UDN49639.1 hypothetical protein JJJ25_19760 [Clostridioides sp. ES-S-0173-01]